MEKTRKRLFASAALIVASIALLAGLTFAWFTDNVTSGRNVIRSGNLDVTLEYSTDGSNWKTVGSDTEIFDDEALWEPGYTQVAYLRVTNNGSLALKYTLDLTVWEEIAGVNVYGKDFKLSDYLMYGAVNEDALDSGLNDRSSAAAFATLSVADSMKISDNSFDVTGGVSSELNAAFGNAVSYQLNLDPGESKESAIVVTMPTTVGNEANHNGEDVPRIEFGIDLRATQAQSESDSFGSDYDAAATFSDLPVASVKQIDVEDLNEDLNAAYSFKVTETSGEASDSAYAYWHADFAVSFDQAVSRGAVKLSGSYGAWQDGTWLTYALPKNLAAGEEYRLLYDYSKEELNMSTPITVNYIELCDIVKEFCCGVADEGTSETGTTMTVELRIYETESDNPNSVNVETGRYEVIGSYTYSF